MVRPIALVSILVAACSSDPVHHLPDGPTPNPAPGLYVTNANGTITVFALDATGDAAPLRTIAGPTTGLSLPIGIAVDQVGDLYVANRTGSNITVYPKTATGDVAPSRTLTATGMGSPASLALLPNGDLLAATCPGCGTSAGGDVGLFHFAAGATTSDRVLTGPNTQLTFPGSPALDGDGHVLLLNSFGGVVATYDVAASGDTPPLRSFTPVGSNGQSMTFGATTIATTSPGRGIDFYDRMATGTPQPVGALDAASLQLNYPAGLVIDTSSFPERIYLVDFGANAIHVIETTGSEPSLAVSSVSTIVGPTTTLSQPLAILVIR